MSSMETNPYHLGWDEMPGQCCTCKRWVHPDDIDEYGLCPACDWELEQAVSEEVI